MTMSNSVTAFAPVNIAWIKYMGKKSGLPINSSLSITLNSLGTKTEIFAVATDEPFAIDWDQKGYIPPPAGIKKVEEFLNNQSLWDELLKASGFEAEWPKNKIKISTQNNVPAGTGVATSASAFAALTLAWSAFLAGKNKAQWIAQFASGDEAFKNRMARVAAKGSGSACRSIEGPWVEWNIETGIKKVEGIKTQFTDLIILVEALPKQVSSSDAHARVVTSPLFEGRAERAERRLAELKELLKNTPDSIPQMQQVVLSETLDMHELFHTSKPAFKYIQPLSEVMMIAFQEFRKALPSQNGLITLDAGANVHLFIPTNEKDMWTTWIAKKFPELTILADPPSAHPPGARYETV